MLINNKTDLADRFVTRLINWTATFVGARGRRYGLHTIGVRITKGGEVGGWYVNYLPGQDSSSVLKTLTITIDPPNHNAAWVINPYDPDRIYSIVLITGAAMIDFGGPKPPDGELGFYRQACGAAFLAHAPTYIQDWRGSGLRPVDFLELWQKADG